MRKRKAYINEMKGLYKRLKRGLPLSEEEAKELSVYRLQKRQREEKTALVFSLLSCLLAVVSVVVCLIGKLI